jgi:hypothetical protein
MNLDRHLEGGKVIHQPDIISNPSHQAIVQHNILVLGFRSIRQVYMGHTEKTIANAEGLRDIATIGKLWKP